MSVSESPTLTGCFLPIEVTGFNVAHSFWFGRTQQDQICREGLTALDTNNVSDLDRVPRFRHESLTLQHFGFARVCLAVGRVSLKVFHDLLDSSGKQDECQWDSRCVSGGGGDTFNLL